MDEGMTQGIISGSELPGITRPIIPGHWRATENMDIVSVRKPHGLSPRYDLNNAGAPYITYPDTIIEEGSESGREMGYL